MRINPASSSIPAGVTNVDSGKRNLFAISQGENPDYNDIDICSVSIEVANYFIDKMVTAFSEAKNDENNNLNGVMVKSHRMENDCPQLHLPKLWGVNFYRNDCRKPVFRVQLSVYDKMPVLESLIRINYPTEGGPPKEVPCLPVHTELQRMVDTVKEFSEVYLVNNEFIPDFDIPRTIIFSPHSHYSRGMAGNMQKGKVPGQISYTISPENEASGKEVIFDQKMLRCCALIMRAIMTLASGEKLLSQSRKREKEIIPEVEWSQLAGSLKDNLNTLRTRIVTHKNYQIFREKVEQWQKQNTKPHQSEYVTHLISSLE